MIILLKEKIAEILNTNSVASAGRRHLSFAEVHDDWMQIMVLLRHLIC